MEEQQLLNALNVIEETQIVLNIGEFRRIVAPRDATSLVVDEAIYVPANYNPEFFVKSVKTYKKISWQTEGF